MRIALDAMGGDHAPGPIVMGAVEAVRDDPDMTVVLVGDQERIEPELARVPDAPRNQLPIVHASQVVGMHESPAAMVRKKRDSSIWIANRPGQSNLPPHDNQVRGLVQSGQRVRPRFAAHLGPGTTRNAVTGTADDWAIARVLDRGSGNQIDVR